MSALLNLIELPTIQAPMLPQQGEPVAPPAPDMDLFLNGEPLVLPEFGMPIDQAPPHYADVTSPGDSLPQRQQFAPPSIDQTRSVVTMATGIPISSNGQTQRRDLRPGQQGITVTTGNGLPLESSGQFQLRDLRPVERAVAGPPLAADVRPDSQNHMKVVRQFAKALPVAVTVDAGLGKPGGLPRPVSIK